MLSRIFPQQIDNNYRGHKLALWLFGLVVFMKGFQMLACIFNGYSTLRVADGIPLDTFTSAGAQTVVSLFALSGFSYLMICLLCVLVLVRYRSMIPFMFALLVLDYLSRRLILHFLPVVRIGTPAGFYVNLVLFALMIIGLALSLWSQDNLKSQK